jgi:hypothetical protein
VAGRTPSAEPHSKPRTTHLRLCLVRLSSATTYLKSGQPTWWMPGFRLLTESSRTTAVDVHAPRPSPVVSLVADLLSRCMALENGIPALSNVAGAPSEESDLLFDIESRSSETGECLR